MKKFVCIILIFFFAAQMIQPGYANYENISFLNNQSNEYADYLRSDYIAQTKPKKKPAPKKPDNTASETPEKPELESPLRRFEITFFISAPFVFMVTFLTLHTYGVIRNRDTYVNVWKDYKPALLIGTFGISTGIAAREAWNCKKYNDSKKDQELQGLQRLNEQTFFLSVYKTF